MKKILALAICVIFLISIVGFSNPLIKAQTASSMVINPDGSVTGAYSVQQVGNIYTLMANISGNIHVESSNIVINGSGYWLNGNEAAGITLNDLNSYPTISVSNVTIENLHITDCSNGILSNGGGNNTFYDDDFSNFEYNGFGIELMGCSYNNISYCTFDNESQISMDYSANFNIVTECNLPSNGILVWLSGSETVDRNYWSDYSTKYPNATEVDHSGIGNTPYVFLTLPNGAQPAVFQDNHPLMKPVTIPLMASSPQPSVPEFPAIAILPLFVSLLFIAVKFRHRKTLNLSK
jgi:hypothetical protein